MTGRHSGLGWPGAIGDHAREATAPPYIGRHRWFQDTQPRHCAACGRPDCTGRIAVDFCPQWQEAEARAARGEYLTTSPVRWFEPRRCEDCGHLEDRCQCPHDCTYPDALAANDGDPQDYESASLAACPCGKPMAHTGFCYD